jgi:hypothetical protein
MRIIYRGISIGVGVALASFVTYILSGTSGPRISFDNLHEWRIIAAVALGVLVFYLYWSNGRK